LAELAEWTLEEGYPAVTGLIVSNDTMMPGLGYFELFRRHEDDFAWWADQITRSLSYDWRRFIADTEPPATPEACDLADPPPDRVSTQVYRILRDTELARRVKLLHEHRCQICGHTIRLPDGSFYAEAHHIQPLGKPHNGRDVMGNILCVCPNHHAELDYAVIAIDLSKLRRADGHQVEISFVQYHNRRIVAALSG
jgi:HNH endonuclease